MKIVIVGAGKLGVNVAKALLGGDHSVTIIDTEDSVLQKISSQMDVMTINGNAKEIKLLKQLHIETILNYDESTRSICSRSIL